MKDFRRHIGNLELVVEYCSGGDLRKLYGEEGKGTLSWGSEPHTQFYTACAAMAVQYLHDKAFIYRDLKPDNLVVDGSGWCKLTDLGLAKQLVEPRPGCGRVWLLFGVLGVSKLAEDKAYASTVCGSVLYMAPEMLRKDAQYDRSVDWWALGILIYELSFGLTPFFDYNQQKVVNSIRRGLKEDSYPPECHGSLKSLLRHVLRKKPSERLQGLRALEEVDFFQNFDWPALKEQRLKPPYQPQH